MDPMFLPGVEHGPVPDSPYTPLIEAARAAGREYPKIWHLFAFKPHATQYLAQFGSCEAVWRHHADGRPKFHGIIDRLDAARYYLFDWSTVVGPA